jgi:REP element-mobilizing transposase RayT
VAVFVHLIWATWDRLPLLTDEITPALYRAIGAKCEELHAQVVAIGGVEDHVHLLVGLPATLTIADLMKHIKGATSHLVNHRLPNGGSFRWQGAYAAFSVDPQRLQRLIDYIANQRQHHFSNTLLSAWEQPTAETPTFIHHTDGSPPRLERT